MKVVLVAAVAENGVIGRDNALPWRIKSDLQYFKRITLGRPVIMGRKTFLSIGKPLPGRTNIVVTRNPEFSAAGVLVAPSLENAVTVARGDALRRQADSVAVIGGTEIFQATMPIADRLALTIVQGSPSGDTYFPKVDPALWHEHERSPQAQGPEDEYPFTFVTYERANAT